MGDVTHKGNVIIRGSETTTVRTGEFTVTHTVTDTIDVISVWRTGNGTNFDTYTVYHTGEDVTIRGEDGRDNVFRHLERK